MKEKTHPRSVKSFMKIYRSIVSPTLSKFSIDGWGIEMSDQYTQRLLSVGNPHTR